MNEMGIVDFMIVKFLPEISIKSRIKMVVMGWKPVMSYRAIVNIRLLSWQDFTHIFTPIFLISWTVSQELPLEVKSNYKDESGAKD